MWAIEKISTDKELFESIENYIHSSLDGYLKSTNKLFCDKNSFFGVYFLPNKFTSLFSILFETEKRAFSILTKKLAENEIDVTKPVSITEINQFCNIQVYDILKNKYDFICFKVEESMEHIKPALELEKLHEDRTVPKADIPNDKGGIGFQQIEIIQNLFNSVIELNRFIQLFSLELNGKVIEFEGKNFDFYWNLDIVNKYKNDFSIYLKSKDYLTKKNLF